MPSFCMVWLDRNMWTKMSGSWLIFKCSFIRIHCKSSKADTFLESQKYVWQVVQYVWKCTYEPYWSFMKLHLLWHVTDREEEKKKYNWIQDTYNSFQSNLSNIYLYLMTDYYCDIGKNSVYLTIGHFLLLAQLVHSRVTCREQPRHTLH